MTTEAGAATRGVSLGRAAIAVAAALMLGALVGVIGPAWAAAGVVAAAVVASAAVAPERAVLLLPLAVYVPVRESLAASVNVTLGDAVLAMLVVGWVIWGWRRKSLVLDPDPLLALLVMMVAAPLLSLAATPSRALTLVGVVRAAELWVLLFIIVLTVVRTEESLIWLVRGFVVVAVAEALLGLYQFVAGAGAYVGGGYTRAIGTGSLYSWLDFAMSLGLAITFIAADLLTRREGGAWRWAALAVLVAGTLATYTRGVWLALLVALVVMILVKKPRAVLVLVAGVALVLALVAANPTGDLAKRVVSLGDPTDPSAVQRLYLWETAINMFEYEPLTGVGAKTFSVLRDRFAVPGLDIYSYHDTPGASIKVELLSPHNFYLMVLAETGILGLMAYLTLFAVLLGRGLRTVRKTKSTRLASAALGLSGGLVFLAVHALIGDVFAGPIALTAAFFLACLAAAFQIGVRADHVPREA